ncbi:unnamed protein product, partial [Didymodactylos carnosus]
MTFRGETVDFGTSDHWPIAYSTDAIGFQALVGFPHVNWKDYKTLLYLLQDFWLERQKEVSSDEWYADYIRFLSALKSRVTQWKNKEKYRPSLPSHILVKLKELRRVRNMYYHKKKLSL